MLRIYYTNKMKRDAKRMQKRGKDLSKLTSVLAVLADGRALAARHRDHALGGNRAGLRECHIEPNWLLVYRVEQDALILVAVETGSHADLFGL